ncbi:hypothetical protein QN277_000620 [Acacia crassicarpa]|uniref:Uncharacterized protein n=1 Tax=Acacia crassicarpa TaxID=499986 RepID=A0AAE1N5E9_9FABA|nr:hypothetical protein QN277_000620 [Acacia crassicarpa]
MHLISHLKRFKTNVDKS